MNISFEEGLAVLEALARNSPHSTIHQISSQTHFDETTIQETLKILEATRYISPTSDSSRISLSPKLWSLGFCLKDSSALKRVADRYLSELAMETRESVCAGVIADRDIVLVAGINVPESAVAEFDVGTKRPVQDCALGKAVLAFQPLHVIGEVEKGLSAMTAGAHAPGALRAELELIRSRGYAIHLDEKRGTECEIAVSVRGSGEAVEAAIGISGPSSRLTPDVIPALAEQILATAEKISRQLS
jgi:DNA-binding IclR family transcriptional regulator